MQKALQLIYKSIHAKGILASPVEQDNYMRIWARDGIMAGLAGLLVEDQKIIKGLRCTLLSLSRHQHKTGSIASNIALDEKNISYGSLAGRVDATTWFIIGAGLYFKKTKDFDFLKIIYPSIESAMEVLEAWEFNGRDLIYTPLSGNWADEYPLHGYLLYDNLLRYWGLKIWAEIIDKKALTKKLDSVKNQIQNNFWIGENAIDSNYHPLAYNRREKHSFFSAGFHPGGYYPLFDACANGLILGLGLASEGQTESIQQYTDQIRADLGKDLIPAFWPPIDKTSPYFFDISNNYSYAFKNKPHYFHNGGIWPIMMGWFSLGLSQTKYKAKCINYKEAYIKTKNYSFHEYINSHTFKKGGKSPLVYSAIGQLFIEISAEEKPINWDDWARTG